MSRLTVHDWTCQCGYRWLISDDGLIVSAVFGPMFAGPGEHSAYWHLPGRMLTHREWDYQYADCSYRWIRKQLDSANPKPG